MMNLLEKSISAEIRRVLEANRDTTPVPSRNKALSDEYLKRAMQDHTLPHQTKMGLLHQAVLLNPFNAKAAQIYGWNMTQIKEVEFVGFLFMERAFHNDMDQPLDPDTREGQWISTLIGRYNHTLHKYKTSKKFLLKAYKSKQNSTDVNAIQLATFITSFPTSVSDAKKEVTKFHQYMDKVLKKSTLIVPDGATYDLFILSAFNFELYYEADIRACMHKYYLLTAKMYPSLLYEARVMTMGRKSLGIASGFLGHNNSVIADFRGVLTRLDRSRFDIVFINIVEKGHQNEFPWPEERHIDVIAQEDNWMQRARERIEERGFDLILYLDSTMSSAVQQLMMSKLARVQAVSHGHPVTSGIPKDIVNYFVSWGAAELPTAQEHYTEELILLRPECMHQYYDHRVGPDGNSAITRQPCDKYTRTFFETVYRMPQHRRWYVCMQKPFKLHPEFDGMLLSILERDRNGVVVLHDCDFEENRQVFRDRLAEHLDRIYFIPALPHHELMGLYSLSDVILDSYYAGGCTTTREALEIGAPVVTLPGKYLGGRWSLAYYEIMGYTDLVASSKEHYVELALQVGPQHKEQILANVHKLFHSQEAVESWTMVLDQMISSNM